MKYPSAAGSKLAQIVMRHNPKCCHTYLPRCRGAGVQGCSSTYQGVLPGPWETLAPPHTEESLELLGEGPLLAGRGHPALRPLQARGGRSKTDMATLLLCLCNNKKVAYFVNCEGKNLTSHTSVLLCSSISDIIVYVAVTDPLKHDTWITKEPSCCGLNISLFFYSAIGATIASDH